MNFTDYQSKSRTTAKYPPIGHPVIYPTLGLTNEAGEVAGKIKKIFRDKGGVIGKPNAKPSKANWATVALVPGPALVPSLTCPWTM